MGKCLKSRLMSHQSLYAPGPCTISRLIICPKGFPGGSAGNETACNVGDLGSIPGMGRSPGEWSGYPLQYSGLENSMDYSPWSCKESDITEQLSLSHVQEKFVKWTNLKYYSNPYEVDIFAGQNNSLSVSLFQPFSTQTTPTSSEANLFFMLFQSFINL